MKSHIILIIALLATIFTACEDRLDEKVFSELAPSTLLTSEKGLSFLLNASYSYSHRGGLFYAHWAPFHMNSMTSGETWGAGGSIESWWVPQIDFTFNAIHRDFIGVWQIHFNSIRDANLVLDNLDNENFSQEFKQLTEAEVHFLRGWSYSALYNWFGALPLYTSSTDDPLLPRASAEETQAFIEQELTLAVSTLPVQAPALGRASKGIAQGVLCKYYLNTKQWQKAADIAQDIINSGQYELLNNYSDVFAYDNEGNRELIWVLPKDGSGGNVTGQALNALIFPRDFPRPFSNNSVFAARTYLFDDFVNSFDPSDTRLNQIITEYTSTDTGELVMGLGNNQSFPYKFPFEPNALGGWAGNDIPIIRYADILLSRAEALNEVSGPTQEAIDLINDVRIRAGVIPLNLADFTTTSLREAILQEREWELYFEEKSREDQIRHGVFISRAQARGKLAQEHHKLFPIPQVELDANTEMEQNPGY